MGLEEGITGTAGMTASEFNYVQKHGRDQEEQLVCETLVCEIRNAKRWIAVVEAWQALLAVRSMAGRLREDRRIEDEACGRAEAQRAA